MLRKQRGKKSPQNGPTQYTLTAFPLIHQHKSNPPFPRGKEHRESRHRSSPSTRRQVNLVPASISGSYSSSSSPSSFTAAERWPSIIVYGLGSRMSQVLGTQYRGDLSGILLSIRKDGEWKRWRVGKKEGRKERRLMDPPSTP